MTAPAATWTAPTWTTLPLTSDQSMYEAMVWTCWSLVARLSHGEMNEPVRLHLVEVG